MKTLELFSRAGIEISLVVIETRPRCKFSKNERIGTRSFDEFRRRSEKHEIRRDGRMKEILRWSIRMFPGTIAAVRGILRHVPVLRKHYVISHAQRLGIPAVRVDRHSCAKARSAIEARSITCGFLISSSWLLKEPLLSIPGTRFVNAHWGYLPRHRAFDSIAWAVLDGDPVGVTTHFIDAGIDTGPIMTFTEVRPRAGEDLCGLLGRIEDTLPEIFLRDAVAMVNGVLATRPQNPEDGVHHRPMTTEELLAVDEILRSNRYDRRADVDWGN